MRKIVQSLIISLVLLVSSISVVSAHVTVKPAEVGVGQRLNFVVSVPTEKDTATTAVRLVIPAGVQSVRPNVKPGWNIEIKKTGEGDDERVSEIIWSGGRIPADQRDEFVFSAQAPSEESTLVWKAYQTYADGEIVAWDTDPEVIEGSSHDEENAPKPYSQTNVIDDLAASTPQPTMVEEIAINTPDRVAVIALILSVLSIGMQVLRKHH